MRSPVSGSCTQIKARGTRSRSTWWNPFAPQVDAFVLDLLESRAFRKKDFFETRKGVCRVMPPLTQLLAETGPRWAAAAAPIAERLTRRLARERRPERLRENNNPFQHPSPKPTAAKAGMRFENASRVARGVSRRRLRRRALSAEPTSRAVNADTARTVDRSDHGMPSRRAHAVLRERRLAGSDPAHGGKAAKLRGKAKFCEASC